MKKILFIDRDGTIIIEPPIDFQVDSLEKLSFLPKAISNLRKIAEESEFELVMVTNQDGLGTDCFPEETFWLPQNKMMEILEGENIHFSAVHIDRTFEHENAPTRKPQTGMLEKYFDKTEYDLKNSFVIGDRITDVQLALNLGANAIYMGDKPLENSEYESVTALISNNWDDIYQFIRLPERKVTVERITKETQIWVELNLDGKGKSKIETGLGFFDHMLDQLAKHSGADLNIKVVGDLHIDEHHTIEDTALALGEAYLKALGDKKGIARYGFNILPMDEALVHAAIDFSGRNWMVWDAKFSREKIGEMPTEMFFHFFKSFTDTAKCNLNIKAEADNEHHKIEAIFKAFAKAIKMATKREIKDLDILPTTKGIL